MYKFVGVCAAHEIHNTSYWSLGMYLWVNTKTRALYISGDSPEIIKSDTAKTKEFMLLYDLEPKEEPQYNPYKQILTNPKRVTKQEFKNKLIYYENIYWKIELPNN